MAAILPTLKLDAEAKLRGLFLPYQMHWIADDSRLCLAEKSVRIGWTYADAFKNVRKRLRHPKRDYLFTTKDEATALEYVRLCYGFCQMFDCAGEVVSHGMGWVRPPTLPPPLAGEVKAGLIKFVNGSRIIAFSSNPNAVRAYGGDVGMDEFAFHPDAEALWAAASGRVTWGFDLAIWSSHNGSDTLFHRFAQEAAVGQGGWSYYRVTLADALEQGLVEKINQTGGRKFSRAEFLADCRARARLPEIFEQEYMCNPAGSVAAVVPWAALVRCQEAYTLERLHLEEAEIFSLFGEFNPGRADERAQKIRQFLRGAFGKIITTGESCRLGFDVAAAGTGDLAVFYIDERKGAELRLGALLTCRTEDWHFLGTALGTFLDELPDVQGCGDETGLGRQICWEASRNHPGVFEPVNFAREKHNLGFVLMTQLAAATKRFPSGEPDVAADYFALRKLYRGNRWTFSEGHNPLNPNSHCDIAWAGALASKAQEAFGEVSVAVGR